MCEMLARCMLLATVCASIAAASNGQVSVASGGTAVAVNGFAELLPGTIVGQGRYVLAEKLCDVQNDGEQAQVLHRHRAQLAPPSTHLLIGPSDDGNVGQLVPFEGLALAISRELPQLPLPASQAWPAFLPGVHDFSVSFVRGHPLFEEAWRFRFGQMAGRGAFGEVWRAVALDGSMREVVLKRLFIEKGEQVRRSGEREIYFGTMLQHRPHIARFIESFEHQVQDKSPKGRPSKGAPPSAANELWLVFHNEGFSLTHHLFRVRPGSLVVELSSFWWRIKQQQPLGGQVIKNFAYQMLHGLAVVHDLNITHRDIKGSNIFVTDTWPPVVRLGDWGSALAVPPSDELLALYGSEGPTEDDETIAYRPPEAVFDEGVLARAGVARAGPWRAQAYDLWSMGVLLLEMILGTHEVFKVDDRRWLRQEHQLRHSVPAERLAQGRKLQAMLDLCIAPRGMPKGAPLSWFFEEQGEDAEAEVEAKAETQPAPLPLVLPKTQEPWCSDEDFADVLRQRDAAGVGLPNREGRDLLRRLLAWAPEDRIAARRALAHSWFDDGAALPPLPAFKTPVDVSRHRGHDVVNSFMADSQEEEPLADRLPCVEDGLTGSIGAPGKGELASSCGGLQLHAAVRTDMGKRMSMEDRHTVLTLDTSCGANSEASASFLGVYDGHSGHATAEKLQRSLHHHLLADPAFPINISAALHGAFSAFDGVLVREAFGDSGSTALVAVAHGCRLHVANLGDCRAVAARRDGSFGDEANGEVWPLGALVEVRESAHGDLRGQRGIVIEVRSAARRIYVVRFLRDGALRPLRHAALRLLSELRAHRLTQDHKPNSESERRRIEALGGSVELSSSGSGPARVAGIATSRCFGSLAARPVVSAEPEVRDFGLDPSRDVFVVLASDGVWDVLDDQLVVDLIWEQVSSVHDSRLGPAAALADAAQLIIQTALERGALDNLTCVVLLLTWAACSAGSAGSGCHAQGG